MLQASTASHSNTHSPGQKQLSLFNLFTGPHKELFFPSIKFLSTKEAENRTAIKTFVAESDPKLLR